MSTHKLTHSLAATLLGAGLTIVAPLTAQADPVDEHSSGTDAELEITGDELASTDSELEITGDGGS